MAVNTTAGTLIYIGTEGFVPSPDNDASAYEADTYALIGEVETIGEYGDEANNVEFLSIGDARVRNLKGARNAGAVSITCGNDTNDAGQAAFIAAVDSNLNYPFKVVYNDKATSMGAGSVDYFRGLAMSRRKNPAGADDVTRITFNVGINTPITSVAAT
jgi:hypothetical protein